MKPALVALILLTAGARSVSSGEIQNLSTEDRAALEIGRAVLRLDELGKAGAPLLSLKQTAELEKNVAFLSETPANRMTWAWLEFRLKNDRELTLENNRGAEAIGQRLDLFNRLLRKYFVFE